jgi:hypothetical protein
VKGNREPLSSKFTLVEAEVVAGFLPLSTRERAILAGRVYHMFSGKGVLGQVGGKAAIKPVSKKFIEPPSINPAKVGFSETTAGRAMTQISRLQAMLEEGDPCLSSLYLFKRLSLLTLNVYKTEEGDPIINKLFQVFPERKKLPPPEEVKTAATQLLATHELQELSMDSIKGLDLMSMASLKSDYADALCKLYDNSAQGGISLETLKERAGESHKLTLKKAENTKVNAGKSKVTVEKLKASKEAKPPRKRARTHIEPKDGEQDDHVAEVVDMLNSE